MKSEGFIKYVPRTKLKNGDKITVAANMDLKQTLN